MTNMVTAPASIHDTCLLTPPLSFRSYEDIPFKPEDTDNVSLSMRKHSRHHRRVRVSCADLRTSTVGQEVPLQTSKSLPNLRLAPSLPSLQPATFRTRASSAPRYGRSRRWTLSSKSASTRCLSTAVHGKGKRPRRTIPQKRDSPAMITLRRATATRPPSRRISFTSFPPPSFSRSGSSFLSSWLSSLVSNVDYCGNPIVNLDYNKPRRKSRAASVDSDTVLPSTSLAAAPVQTEVAVRSSLSLPGKPIETNVPTRRCSTKYFSGNSIYEIIWDENVISTTSDDRSPERSITPATDARRQSVAMDKLETQLFKAVAQSRRQSAAVRELEIIEDLERQNSYMPEWEALNQRSFQDMLSYKFSKIANESALKNLPRSKRSKMSTSA